jgi:hypothetical protein
MTNDDGTPYDDRYGFGSMLENGGDTIEALEECYGMIWWLAQHRARLRFATTHITREQILDVIRSAQESYQDGVRLGKGD